MGVMPSCPLAIRPTFTRPERCARRDGHRKWKALLPSWVSSPIPSPDLARRADDQRTGER